MLLNALGAPNLFKYQILLRGIMAAARFVKQVNALVPHLGIRA